MSRQITALALVAAGAIIVGVATRDTALVAQRVGQIYGWDGASDRPIRTSPGGHLFSMAAPHWQVGADPAVNVVATATQAAAGAGISNVADCLIATFVGGTTAPAAVVGTAVIRDGAAGAGAIIFAADIAVAAAVASNPPPVQICGLHIPGTANTAMTAEFMAAGGLNTFQTVRLTGYTR